VIQVEHDSRRRLWVAGDEVGHQRLGQPIEVFPVHAVCKPREGRRTRQVLLWSQGEVLHAQLKQRVATEAVGVMAVRIAGGELIDTLGQEVAQGVINVGGMTWIVDGGREACGEANLAIDAAE
jgi:hypothetical protein